ncbi:MAG: AAA family ATPase [Planctomycetaceae bacterium]|nr:AAA family ATPase [Planctomycetaceae bacterium]
MRIRELEIDRFGVWQDVSLSLDPHGVTAFYGPNEAGKSTLMRFVRGVLFGYQPQDERTPGPHPTTVSCAGSLVVTHEGQDYVLRRVSTKGTRGQLEINGRAVADHDPLIEQIRGEASESLFQNIFAIGLNELQQLATLSGEEVAQHVYGLSLGPDGQRILRTQTALSQERTRLLGEDQRSGEINSLLKQLEQIDREIAKTSAPTEQHAQLQQRRLELEENIATDKRRQRDLQQALRGHQFIQRAWVPWSRERDLQRQLKALPAFDLSPETLERFDELDLELAEVEGTRRRLLEDARRLKKQSDDIRTRPEFEEHACRIQNLFDQRDKMQAIERRLAEGTSPVVKRQPVPEVQPLLSRIDARWTTDQLERLDTSPNQLSRLMRQADGYRAALRKRGRIVKRYKQRSVYAQRKQKEWEQRVKLLGTESPPEARKQLQKRIAELEELGKLRTRRDQLSQAAHFLSGPAMSRVVGHELPPFFWTVLWFFAAGGIVLLACGLYAAGHNYENIVRGDWTAALVGAIYGLMGLSALALAYTMRQHFTSQEVRISGAGNEHERLQQELETIDETIRGLTRSDALRPALSQSVARSGETEPVSDRQLLARLRQELADLQGLEELGQRVERMRKKLSGMRQQLQDVQKGVSRSRREWGELLRGLGMQESLKTEPAIRTFAQLTEAKSLWQQGQQTVVPTVDRDREDLEEYRQQVETLGVKLHGAGYRVRDYYRDVADWEQEVRAIAERRRERLQLRKSAKEKKVEADRHLDRLKRLQQQRTALLARLGVSNRDEIQERLAMLEQRSGLERKIQDVRSELMRLAETEPELAIVDDHFRDFSEDDAKRSIEKARSELSEVEASLELWHEELGRVRQELREVEDDRRLTSLRFDRVQVMAAIKAATDRWCATRLADDLVGSLRERIEKGRQPRTLKRASEYLQDLTLDRYQNIWTPLGERTLVVDDDQHKSLRIDQLSSGTREQVFLAIRLAMVDGLSEQGMELPLVLDDVTVNFDQVRSEAAVKTLLQAAEEGQQIMLFTCHLHLMHLFQNNGVEPVCLPGHAPLVGS